MSSTIRLGISTCPNDTFAFHGLLARKVTWQGLDFQVELLDVEQLNQRLLQGDFDVAKASFPAAFRLSDQVALLDCGSALGFGVGPLLLAGRNPQPDDASAVRVLCPGAATTATLLYRMFYPNQGTIRQVVFSEIMPALQAGDADLGVCIHEGRFTYQQHGLRCVADLGKRWEQETGCPLPLGGIVGRRSLGRPLLRKVQQILHGSLRYASQHRQEALITMRQYAQELSEEVIFAHVDTYVNEWTESLGTTGRAAVGELQRRAVAAGGVEIKTAPLRCVD